MTDDHWQKKKTKRQRVYLTDRIHADRKSAFETGKKTDRQRVSLTYMIADRQTECQLDRLDSRQAYRE